MTDDPQDDVVQVTNDPVPETARCKVCREDIKPGAQKCIHCGMWQNWRRFILFDVRDMTALFGILIAFASLIYSARLDIQKWFGEDNSSLRFAYLRASHDDITIQVFNSGIEPGLAIGAALDVTYNAKHMSWLLKPDNQSAYGSGTVAPRQTAAISLRAVKSGGSPDEAPGLPDTCTLTIRFQNFQDNAQSIELPLDCEEVLQFGGMAQSMSNGN